MNQEQRMKWWTEAKFGMFIHWGLYSVLGRGEWTRLVERIPGTEYAKLAEKFNPPKSFTPELWVKAAKNTGMKYMILTTRHHDGFCLFDSKVSDFTSVKTAAKRDFVKEYVAACRKHNMRVGLYYSLLDWRFPGYFNRKNYRESFKAMVQQAHSQVRELMTSYGKIDILWYDGGWIPGTDINKDTPVLWKSKKLNGMVRKLQPHIIINDRAGLPEDTDTPEQNTNASKAGRYWESCMTMGDFCGWGYTKNNPNMKPATQLIQNLVTCASNGGNYLLNIGPKPDGGIRKDETLRLKEIGRWMKKNGEAIYGTERLPSGSAWEATGFGFWGAGMLGMATAKGNNAYLHIFRWPGSTAVITGIGSRVLSAEILASGKKLRFKHEQGKLVITGMPSQPPDKHGTVIKLKLKGRAETFDYAGLPLPE